MPVFVPRLYLLMLTSGEFTQEGEKCLTTNRTATDAAGALAQHDIERRMIPSRCLLRLASVASRQAKSVSLARRANMARRLELENLQETLSGILSAYLWVYWGDVSFSQAAAIRGQEYPPTFKAECEPVLVGSTTQVCKGMCLCALSTHFPVCTTLCL